MFVRARSCSVPKSQGFKWSSGSSRKADSIACYGAFSPPHPLGELSGKICHPLSPRPASPSSHLALASDHTMPAPKVALSMQLSQDCWRGLVQIPLACGLGVATPSKLTPRSFLSPSLLSLLQHLSFHMNAPCSMCSCQGVFDTAWLRS